MQITLSRFTSWYPQAVQRTQQRQVPELVQVLVLAQVPQLLEKGLLMQR